MSTYMRLFGPGESMHAWRSGCSGKLPQKKVAFGAREFLGIEPEQIVVRGQFGSQKEFNNSKVSIGRECRLLC